MNRPRKRNRRQAGYPPCAQKSGARPSPRPTGAAPEYFRALYPAARGDGSSDHSHNPGGHCGLWAFCPWPRCRTRIFPWLWCRQAAAQGRKPLAATVATPLERALGRIAGVTEMTSSSSLGATQVILQFDLNRNMRRDPRRAVGHQCGAFPLCRPCRPIPLTAR